MSLCDNVYGIFVFEVSIIFKLNTINVVYKCLLPLYQMKCVDSLWYVLAIFDTVCLICTGSLNVTSCETEVELENYFGKIFGNTSEINYLGYGIVFTNTDRKNFHYKLRSTASSWKTERLFASINRQSTDNSGLFNDLIIKIIVI